MKDYEVIITPDAEDNLRELKYHIAVELHAPETAVAYVHDIREEVATLRKAPRRFRLVEKEPWHSRGVRRMNARNFAVFFIIREEESNVYVQNVIYQKRDLPNVLARLYPHLGEL